MNHLPTLDHERRWWKIGATLVAGVDEVGRGALAGPLVAAAVVFPPGFRIGRSRFADLTDSKLLPADRRGQIAEMVGAVAVCTGIGSVSSVEIDLYGLTAANRLAMERAIAALQCLPDALLLDAFTVDLGIPQIGLIDGDALCVSIAAASVLAKVTRDRWMCDYHDRDPRYAFANHKGYGTAQHLAALREVGPCEIHRHSFAPVASCLAYRL